MKLDFSNAWTDAMGLLRGHAGAGARRSRACSCCCRRYSSSYSSPFQPSEPSFAAIVREFPEYVSANGRVLLIVAIVTGVRASGDHPLLLDPARPTVGQALARALPLLPWYFLTNLIVGLILVGGAFAVPAPRSLSARAARGRAVVAVAAENRRNPFDAIRRTFDVTKGNGWRAFLLIAIVVGDREPSSTLAAGTIFGISSPSRAARGASVRIVSAFVSALLSALLALIMLLIHIAIYRQLGERSAGVPATKRHMRRNVARADGL